MEVGERWRDRGCRLDCPLYRCSNRLEVYVYSNFPEPSWVAHASIQASECIQACEDCVSTHCGSHRSFQDMIQPNPRSTIRTEEISRWLTNLHRFPTTTPLSNRSLTLKR